MNRTKNKNIVSICFNYFFFDFFLKKDITIKIIPTTKPISLNKVKLPMPPKRAIVNVLPVWSIIFSGYIIDITRIKMPIVLKLNDFIKLL